MLKTFLAKVLKKFNTFKTLIKVFKVLKAGIKRYKFLILILLH